MPKVGWKKSRKEAGTEMQVEQMLLSVEGEEGKKKKEERRGRSPVIEGYIPECQRHPGCYFSPYLPYLSVFVEDQYPGFVRKVPVSEPYQIHSCWPNQVIRYC